MKDIEHISDQIEKEINSAEDYIKCALNYKEKQPQLAETYYRIASEKLSHMGLLHNQVVTIIDEYNKTEGETPKVMQMLYDILHRKHIEHAAAVRGMLALYKES